MYRRSGSLVLGFSLVAGLSLTCPCDRSSRAAEVASDLDFNRVVKPILSNKCFRCHGPDEALREAGLRLDVREIATGELDSGSRAIVPGSPDESELVLRIESDDADERMPPPEANKSLTDAERSVLRAWIENGAEYARHWSFIPPEHPQPPEITDDTWSQNAIDPFVLRRQRQAGLKPSPEADRRTLIRRLSFDLTGLPPTIEEVDAFVSDESADAYERVVDRLLASPRYGERMASHWLDLARYADTDGYEKDSHRQMWPYRDWVIEAYNANMPFDQFTVEQLAGDLLPGSTQSQKIASAFNRNGPTTSEGGANPDEYAAKYAVDRVTTTSTVWLGLTVQCAECHDHKFDPLPTKDFYKLFAFFNQVPEQPLYEGAASPPSMPVPTKEQSAAYGELEKRLASIREEAKGIEEPTREHPDLRDGLVAEYTFDEPNGEKSGDTSGKNHQARIMFSNVQGNSSPERWATPLGRGVRFRGGGAIKCGGVWEFDISTGVSYGAWVKPIDRGGVVLSKIDPQQGSRGFDLILQEGRAIAHVIDRWSDAAIKVTTATSYTSGEWVHVFVTWDGGSKSDSVRIFFNGEEQPLEVKNLAGQVKDIGGDTPFLIGCRSAEESPMHGTVDEVRVYDRALSARDVIDLIEFSASRVAGNPLAQRSYEQALFLADCYRFAGDGTEASWFRERIAESEAEQARLRDEIPQVRIMKSVDVPRPTFILVRGDFRSLGERVEPDIPSAFGSLPKNRTADRLALAEWIVGNSNPLTARVTVNRLWALCFGRGIVSTLNDFGSQGERPTDPELLDLLATEFVSSGWDTKGLLKNIVMSSTYRQSSRVTEELLEADSGNLLLARGPRFRMPAEMLRDNALFVSGLLQEHIGGPSVFPYHPPGLWEEMAWADSPWKSWVQDHERDLYRRGLYTFWKRSMLHPALSVFDAPARNVCEVRRSVTNTPLQAFVTLNETSFVEAARVLAERVMREHPDDEAARVDYAYRLVLSRPPHEAEAEALLNLARQALDRYTRQPELAEEFLSVGESPRSTELDAVEQAAWTTVAQAVLNLDETLTKE